MLRVLIGDDHPEVRAGLRQMLRELPEAVKVGEALDGEDVLAKVKADHWDLVILDVTMPRLNGLQTLRRLKQLCPALPVLMLSMHTSQAYINHSLASGAAGYLNKATVDDDLPAAIRAAMRGEVYVSRSLRASLPWAPRREQLRASVMSGAD